MKARHIIAAVTDDYGIGCKGELLYRIKADMQHFKDLTLGNVVIMGRKTFESIGKPLPSRDNIVVTSKDLNIDGVHCVRSLQDAYRLAETLDGIKVLGNGTLEKKLTVKANRFSSAAVTKIESAGGTAEVI